MSALKTDSGSHVSRLDCLRGDDRGFTLVETLVALAVFAMAFAGLYRALEGGWQGLRRAQFEIEAIEVAKAQLAATGIATPLVEGRQSGVTAEGVRWQIDIRQRRSDSQQSTNAIPRTTSFDVSVTAGRVPAASDRTSAVALKTVKLGERTP